MERYGLLLSLAVVITLTAVFSLRVSVDALAMVLGLFLGVVASLPTVLLLIYVLLRQQKQQSLSEPHRPASPQPPVVVINTPDKSAMAPPPMMSHRPTVNGRKWTVIGDAETLD